MSTSRLNKLSPGIPVRRGLCLVTILVLELEPLTILEETQGHEIREMSNTSRASQVYSEQDISLESPVEGVAFYFLAIISW